MYLLSCDADVTPYWEPLYSMYRFPVVLLSASLEKTVKIKKGEENNIHNLMDLIHLDCLLSAKSINRNRGIRSLNMLKLLVF